MHVLTVTQGNCGFFYSQMVLPLFPSGILQHINVMNYLWIVQSWLKVHIDFVIIPRGNSRFFPVSGCCDCSLKELCVLCIVTVP